MLQRVRNRINECHRKLSTFLCREYGTILLPKFESSRMVRKRERKINSKTSRSMLTWSHYRFRERLRAKAELEGHCEVIICDEAYTTKTCGKCGTMNHNVGGTKIFRCVNRSCGHIAHRDLHDARNILLRYVSLNNIEVRDD